MIAKDIQSLLSEKIQLEKESQNTDYNMSVKKTELHSLQSEYDTLASTLKQLTNQKDVAQKRLDDLDTQVCNTLIRLVEYLNKEVQFNECTSLYPVGINIKVIKAIRHRNL